MAPYFRLRRQRQSSKAVPCNFRQRNFRRFRLRNIGNLQNLPPTRQLRQNLPISVSPPLSVFRIPFNRSPPQHNPLRGPLQDGLQRPSRDGAGKCQGSVQGAMHPGGCSVLHNPFQDQLFRPAPTPPRRCVARCPAPNATCLRLQIEAVRREPSGNDRKFQHPSPDGSRRSAKSRWHWPRVHAVFVKPIPLSGTHTFLTQHKQDLQLPVQNRHRVVRFSNR